MKLKVCGITNEADAVAIAQLGVDYLGYIMNYPASPRYILPAVATKMITMVKRLYPGVQHVAVLVEPTEQLIKEVEAMELFDVLQIYGTIPNNVTLPVIQSAWGKVLPPQVEQVMIQHCDKPDVFTGIEHTLPLMISGGISPTNVERIIEQCQPEIIDANSGVELMPGKKDISKVYELRHIIFSH